MTTESGQLILPQKWTISCHNLPDSIQAEARRFAQHMQTATGQKIKVSSRSRRALVKLDTASDPTLGTEGYKLQINPKGIHIEARTTAGFFYAFQTLKQLLPPHVMLGKAATAPAGGYTLPCLNIKNRHRDLTGNVQIFVPVLISGGCVKHKRNTWYWWEILY